MFRHDLLDDSGQDLRSHSVPVFELVATVSARSGPTEHLRFTTDLWASVHGIAVLSNRRALDVISGVQPDDLLAREVSAHLDTFDR